MKYIISFWISLFVSLSALAQEVPADWEFVTLHTPHFSVIVNARQQELGQLYAEKLEQTYDFLVPLFTSVPEKITVVINDKTDLTNGYATPLPYSHIMIYPVLPGPADSLGESGDWALELLAHEYTHVLTFAPARGFMKYLRYFLGTVVAPNVLLPRWWKEGVAVEIETRISSGGRLRSGYQDAIIRSLAQSRLLTEFDLAQVNEILPTWPEGHRPYLFGSLAWSEMTAQKGAGVIDRLHQRHGGRMPYFLEAPAKDLLGKTYVSLYKDTLRETQTRAEKQIKKLQEKPLTTSQFLSLKTQYLNHPSISPDGRYMAVISVDETKKREVKLLERIGDKTFNESEGFKKIESFKEEQTLPQPQDGPPSGSIQRVAWFHQSPRLVYDKVDAINRIERYSDLHVYDLKTQKSSQLTTGLRGREPSVSADDREIVFVKLEGGKTSLGIYELSSKSEKILWTAPMQSRISSPLFLDQNRILFALRSDKAEENLWIFDRKTSESVRILESFKDARFPLMTSQGVFFTSSQNGVHNLYLADSQLRQAKPVTHVLSSVFTSAWDPLRQDLYVAMMSDQGPQVARVAASEWRQTPASLPVIEPLFADRYPQPQPLPAKPAVVQSQEPYSAGSYLWPRYWIPYLYTSSVDNSVVFQASTSGFDPLKKHAYSVTGAYESALRRGSLLGEYQNNQLPWPILLHSSEVNSFFYDVDNLVTHTNASLSVWPEVWALSRYMLLEIGAKYSRTQYNEVDAVRHGAFFRTIYSNYSKSGTQISPESGQTAYLGATNYYYNSQDLIYNQYVFGGTSYLSRWLPVRHALMLKLNGFYVKEELSAIYGASTGNFMPIQDTPAPLYTMRGYKTGQFFGKELFNLNAEYRFPMQNIYWGSGTAPFFINRLHGALVIDGVSLEGRAYNTKNESFESVDRSRSFWSGGFETRLESTVGYVLPLQLVLGVYSAHNADHGPKFSANFGIQASDSF